MKSSLILSSVMALCAAAFAAQQAPKAPLAPVAPAAVPAPPAPPARLDQHMQEVREAAQEARKAAEETAKARFELADMALWDPFNDRDDPDRTLIIPQAAGEAEHQADTQEDLEIMSHILEKASATREERTARSVGIFFRSPFGSFPALRNLYLEGYGAVFFLNVTYSLTPPPVRGGEQEAKPARDSEWEAARRELSQPRGSRTEAPVATGQPDAVSGSRAAAPFDADKVENLKKNLAEALKNAVHIRKLKPDESVTIVVTGRSPSSLKPLKVKPNKRADDTSFAARERLILRAKKSDIEDFEGGKLTLEDFRKRVTLFFS